MLDGAYDLMSFASCVSCSSYPPIRNIAILFCKRNGAVVHSQIVPVTHGNYRGNLPMAIQEYEIICTDSKRSKAKFKIPFTAV